MSRAGIVEHFVCRIILEGESLYCLWFTNGADGVVTQSGKVLMWRSEATAREHAKLMRVDPSEAVPSVFDLDVLRAAPEDYSALQVKDLLDIWNFFTDVASSVGDKIFADLDGRESELHARVSAFCLSDILRSSQDHLTAADIEATADVLRAGVTMVKKNCLLAG